MENQKPNGYSSGNRIPIILFHALSYAGGILIFLFFKNYFYAFLGLFTVVLLGVFFIQKQLHQTLFFILLFITLGYFSASIQQPDKNHLLTTYRGKGVILGKITSKIQKTSNGYYKFTVASQELIIDGSRQKATGLILMYTDSLAGGVNYNDYILLNKPIEVVKEPQNPQEFNFKRYLNFHHIYFNTFCSASDFATIPNPSFSVFKVAHRTQEILLENLLKEISSSREKQTISALVLGKRDELDKNIIANFSASGAMHVLAVSGLHVGILLLIIRFLFQRIFKKIFPKWSEVIITLLLIWFFAFITGLSASVVRAACMFSFIICGTFYKKGISIYAVLAASALCMMAYNPYIITEVGFQLSYAAVIGIVFFTPEFLRIIPTSKWWLINKITTITAVSIAAQLATFPVALLYFHQFPTYFIFSNLIVIPCAFLIVITGIAKLVLGMIPFLKTIITQLLFWSSWALNEVSEKVALLPAATLNQIDISILETYLLYGVVVSLFLAFFKRDHRAIKTAFFFILLISFSMIYEHFNHGETNQLVVYNIKRHSAFDLINGENHLFKTNSSLLKNEDKMQYHIKHYWYHQNLKAPLIDYSNTEIKGYNLKNTSIHHVTKKVAFKNKITTDYLLISNNSMNLKDAVENFNFKKVIYDSSNSNHFLSCIRNSPLYTDSVYIVSEQGSIIIQF